MKICIKWKYILLKRCAVHDWNGWTDVILFTILKGCLECFWLIYDQPERWTNLFITSEPLFRHIGVRDMAKLLTSQVTLQIFTNSWWSRNSPSSTMSGMFNLGVQVTGKRIICPNVGAWYFAFFFPSQSSGLSESTKKAATRTRHSCISCFSIFQGLFFDKWYDELRLTVFVEKNPYYLYVVYNSNDNEWQYFICCFLHLHNIKVSVTPPALPVGQE